MSKPWPRPLAALDGCTGLHVPPALEGAEALTWYPLGRPERLRVFEHTCPRHGGPSYELCQAGGHYLIRRTIGMKVWDTPRARHRVVMTWWRALLGGAAV